MRALAVLACIVILAGCGTTGRSNTSERKALRPVTTLIPLTDSQEGSVHQGIRERLKDPQSAIFGQMISGPIPGRVGSTLVCGWVNAKNSYGGYAGDKPFTGLIIGLPDDALVAPSFILIGMGGTDRETDTVLKHCALQGLPLRLY
jgi:hypothetical protein